MCFARLIAAELRVNMPAAWLKAAELRLICFARLMATESLVNVLRTVNGSRAAG